VSNSFKSSGSWGPLRGNISLPEHLSSPPVFSGIRVARFLVFCAVFCRSLIVLLFLFFWSLCCLFFDLRNLIGPLVSSYNSSRYYSVIKWLLFNAIRAIFQLYRYKNNLHSMKWWWRPFCTRPTRLVHWNNHFRLIHLKQSSDENVAPLDSDPTIVNIIPHKDHVVKPLMHCAIKCTSVAWLVCRDRKSNSTINRPYLN
jgi:hypothetical protein